MLSALLKRLWRRPRAAELRAAGKHALDGDDPDSALRMLDAAIRSAPDDAEALFFAGVAELRLGAFEAALARFERCIALVPTSADAYHHAAHALHQLDRDELARRYCDRALELAPVLGGAHTMLSRLTLPGPAYTELLAALHRKLRPLTYVEIGVSEGASLQQALPSTRVVGIDPEPRLTKAPGPNVQIHAVPSDDYFRDRNLFDDLGCAPVDLAFIDGAHVFDQALRDFINVERHATPASTILLHDTYPLNRITAERERRSSFWSGDVWRLVLILAKYRPDLAIANVATGPTGLCIVRGLDPASRVLAEAHDAIVEAFMAVDYGVLDGDKAALLRLVPNDLERALERVGIRRTAAPA